MRWQFRRPWRKGTRIVASPRERLWQKCEQLEFKIFSDCNYINDNGRNRLHEFDGFQRSVFIASGREVGTLTGTMRLVFNNGTNMEKSYFPTLANARLIGTPDDGRFSVEKNQNQLLIYEDSYARLCALPATGCVDVSTMAVLPENRDTSVSGDLISRAIFLAWEMSVRYALGAIDTRFLKKVLQRGLPFVPLGPAVHYWGSPTTPVLLDTYRVPKGVWRVMIQMMKMKGLIGGVI